MERNKLSHVQKELLRIIYRLIYIAVYALIIIGEAVRKTSIWLLTTIGFFIYEGLCAVMSRLSGLRFLLLLIYRAFLIPVVLLRKLAFSVAAIVRHFRKQLQIPQLRSIKWFLFGSAFTALFVLIPYIVVSWLGQLPNPQTLSYMKFPATTKFFDRNGKLLYELYAEIDRQPLPLSAIPQVMIDATIAIEDQEFYHHLGFSPRGIARALKETLLKHDLQGGSTITQQLIKNTLLTPEPTFKRKLKELILAFWAERIYSKDEILEMYLNNVAYGGTAWGVKAASQKYFNKGVADLTLAEAALLAGLPAAPTTYSPFGAHPELAKQRQELVLKRMQELGYITKADKAAAKKQQLVFNSQLHNINAPHFVMYTKQQLEEKYGPRLVEQGGLQIKTSLDLELQNVAQQIVQQELEKLAPMHVGNAAVLVTHPVSGEILAMVGSRNYFDKQHDGNVNITTTLQQPGSSIKVVNYAVALQKGFTAATIINDAPVSFPQPNGRVYQPVNYDGKFHGPVPLRWALASSYNVPAVKVLNKIGVEAMVQQGKLMGIDSWENSSRFGLSLTLGGGEVTLLDMAEVYGTLANGGKRVELNPVLEVVDFKGETIEQFTTPVKVEALPPEVAFILTDILADNQARTPAFGRNSLLYIPDKYVAVKTGTSNDKRDNWAIGYTKDFVVVVWVGNNDNSPMSQIASGITGATPIWRAIMDYLLQDREALPPTPPDKLIKLPCYGRQEYFIQGTEPKNGCIRWPFPRPTPTLAQ